MFSHILGSIVSESATIAGKASVKVASEALEDYLSQEETQEFLEETISDSIARSSASQVAHIEESLDNYLDE